MTHLEALYHFIGSDVNQCALYLCCEWVHQEIRANGLSHSMKFFKVWSLKNYFAIWKWIYAKWALCKLHLIFLFHFRSTFSFTLLTYRQWSQSLIASLFINPISCTCSTLLPAPDRDARTHQPPSFATGSIKPQSSLTQPGEEMVILLTVRTNWVCTRT